MRHALRIVGAVALFVTLSAAAAPTIAGDQIGWAFPVNAAGSDTSAPDKVLRHHLPGSLAAFTEAQADDIFAPPDWYPQDHPVAPQLVAQGRQPSVFACGYCHLPDGAGRPENARLAGLPASYIVAQIRAFADGSRQSSHADFPPALYMRRVAAAAADDPGLADAARYFAALKPAARIKVVETATVPRTTIAGFVHRISGPGQEKLSGGVIEIPTDFDRFELRDPRMTYTAYVPQGSLRAGEVLVHTGGGKTTACVICHGADLRGSAIAPALAGRSPGYLARQIFDIKSGARHDMGAAPMIAVAATLNNDDIVAATAYFASLPP